MQQYVMWGNQFQNQMWIKFNRDIGSMSARIVNTRERENLVYEYINSMGTILPAANYSFGKNMSGLYGDHEAFKKHFVRYWRNALNFSREESEKLKDIFDGELSSQESCERLAAMAVFFEDGRALTIDDCLSAVYEALKIA